MVTPEAEIVLDEAAVRQLLAEQHPDLAERALVHLDAGWDNVLWRLGDDLAVRLPRRETARVLAEREHRWLPELAPHLPLPVPVPLRTGAPSSTFPWPWSVVPWIDGEPADRAPMADTPTSARRLGAFLRALHRPAPPDAPRNSYRGVPVADRTTTVDERLAALAGEVDGDALRALWAAACAAPRWSGPPVWLHGDLHPANVLTAGGELAAVIDFGDLCAGDPATDLAAAWMHLDVAHHRDLVGAYGGADDALWARARGWAVLFGLMLLAIGLDDKPTYEPVGRRTLARALAEPPGGPQAGSGVRSS